MRDAEEGEMRFRMQCNLCGRVAEGAAILAPEAREDMFKVIRECPDDALEAVRAAVHFAAGWLQVPLPDGGVVDVCCDCQEGPWLREEVQL
jgi:hypothetical protein